MSLGNKVGLYMGAPSSGDINGRIPLILTGINLGASGILPLYMVSGPIGSRLPMYIKTEPVGKLTGRTPLFLMGIMAAKLPLFLQAGDPVGARMPMYCLGRDPVAGKLNLWLGSNLGPSRKLPLIVMGI